MGSILMLTPENEEIEVPEEHFETATTRDKFEPAFEYVDPKTKQPVVVRKKHAARAEKDGLVAKPVWDAQNKPIDASKIGAGEASARGFANAATLGFADEISAGANALGSAVKKGTLADLGKDYDAKRENYRVQDDAAWDQQGLAYGIGYGGAALPTLAANAPLKVGASAAQLAAQTGKAAAGRAALEGGAQGLGGGTDAQGQADLTKGEFGEAALQTGISAATGGLLGGGTQKLSQGLAGTAREGAERAAYRATGGMKSDINKIYGNTPEQVGRALLDEGMVPLFGKRAGKEIEERIRNRVGELSTKQDEFLTGLDADQAAGVPFEAIEAKLMREIESARSGVGSANMSYANAIEKELEILQQKFKPTRSTETVVGRPGETKYVPGERRDVVVTGSGSAAKEKVSMPDGMGGFREVEVDAVGPRKVESVSRQAEGELERAPTRLTTVKGSQSANPKTLTMMEALETKRAFDKGGKFQNRTDAASVEGARTSRKAVKDAIDEAIAASKAGPEAMATYRADRGKTKLLLDALRGLEQEGERQTARKQVFGLTDTIAGGGVFAGAMAAGLSNPATAALTLGTVGGKKLIENFGDSFSARTLDASSKLIERYGFEEGMRRISRALGPDAAAQIGIALGERK